MEEEQISDSKIQLSPEVLNSLSQYLKGLSAAVDQQIIPVSQARFLAKAMLISTGLLTANYKRNEVKKDAVTT